jgi:hypothetical protein
MKAKLEIEITKIEVEGRYYSIDYTSKYKGVTKELRIESDHAWGQEEFLEELKDGTALTLAYVDFCDNHIE